MKRLVVLATSIVVIAAIVAGAGGADPGQNPNGPKRDGSQGHWYKRACAVPAAHLAACDAQVVTDSAGNPLVTNTTPHGYTPAQLAGAYALASLSSSATIGIVDAFDDPNIEADLAVFTSHYGLTPCTTANGCLRKVNQSGGTSYPTADAGWSLEIALDVETAHAICPTCKILLVEATTNSMTNLGTAVNRAVSMGANVVSNSYGGSESSSESTLDSLYYNHPGVVITASSGDGGYGVEYPAASRYVTAVGGTSLTVDSGNQWVSETAWSGAGSGCSAYEPKPSWQTDTGCARRTVADVSADADPNTGASVYDSVAYQGQSGWFQVGGTSLASPLIASVYALAGSTTGSTPYSHPSSLHDVTSGSNGSCSPNYLCTAASGFDGPTGLGTPNGLGAFTATSPTPDFSIGVSPSPLTVPKGTDAVYTVSTSGSNGFSGSVSLSASGVSATFGTSSLRTPGNTTMTVATGSLDPGTYPITITGQSGNIEHTAAATLVVQATQDGDFSLSVSGPTTIPRSGSTAYTVTVNDLSGFTGAVTMSATDNSSGLTESFSPVTTTSTSKLTLRSSGLRHRTSYTVTVTGTSDSLSHSVTLQLST